MYLVFIYLQLLNDMEDLMAWTLTEVAKRTGAKPRSVQLWADAGIVLSVEGTDRGGSGVHRQFELDEVRLIALLVPLAKWGVPIRWLKEFAKSFRKEFQSRSKPWAKSPVAPKFSRAYERAAEGKGRNYLMFSYSKNVLGFDVVTDELGPATIDLKKIEDELSFPEETHMIGILSMTSVFQSLGN